MIMLFDILIMMLVTAHIIISPHMTPFHTLRMYYQILYEYAHALPNESPKNYESSNIQYLVQPPQHNDYDVSHNSEESLHHITSIL